MDRPQHNTRTTPPVTGSWRKSTFTNQGNCFELAPTTDGIALRNSNDPDRGTLHFSRSELGAFIQGVKAGEFDDLVV